MQRSASHPRILITAPTFALLTLLSVATAHAAVRMQVASLTLPGMQFSDLQTSLAPAADGRLQLQMRAAHLTLPALGWKDVGVSLSGVPVRTGPNAWRLDGQLALTRTAGNALNNANVSVLIDTDASSLDLTFNQKNTSIRTLMPLDQPSHLQLSLKGVPLAWLQGALVNAWTAGRLTSGTVGGELALDIPAHGAQLSGQISVANGGFDSKSGTLAGQQVGARGSFKLDTTSPDARLDFDGTLNGGQLLLGSLFAQLPAHTAQLQVSSVIGTHGIAINDLQFDDGDALSTNAKLAIDAKGNMTSLQLDHLDVRLPASYTRYAKSWLDAMGWKNLTTAGRLTGSIAMQNGVPAQFDLKANDVAVSDGEGRVVLTGLNGTLDWDAHALRPQNTLSWKTLALNKMPLGAATLHFKSDGGALTLTDPAQITLLGGTFSLQKLIWRPAADKQDRINASFAVSDIDLAVMCKLFGWPAFTGTLGGAVPGLRYSGDRILLDGGLSMHVFDGFVDVTSLTLEHPFGVAPVMTADVDIRQLDLALLTGVFDFGSITGRLDGKIDNLNLVDWKPVAFDAALHADGGGRISQRALQSLTEVGGGGIAAGLQGLALSLFKTFGYSRIGLTCVLKAQVCMMGGIDSAASPQGGGYTIVDGKGLPHISVIGHQREVDWPTLVDRLKAATENGGPVIE